METPIDRIEYFEGADEAAAFLRSRGIESPSLCERAARLLACSLKPGTKEWVAFVEELRPCQEVADAVRRVAHNMFGLADWLDDVVVRTEDGEEIVVVGSTHIDGGRLPAKPYQ